MNDFYKRNKDSLLQTPIYSYLLDSETPGSFEIYQKELELVSSSEFGLGLGFGAMAEINSVGTILQNSNNRLSQILLDKISHSNSVICLGVSEDHWGNHLRKLSEIDINGNCSGTKSFVTNAPSSEGILLVLRLGNTYPVYYFSWAEFHKLNRQCFTETSLPLVYHERIYFEISIEKGILIHSDYKALGKIIQKKESFSMLSLLFGLCRFCNLPFESLSSFISLRSFIDQTFRSIKRDTENQLLSDLKLPEMKLFFQELTQVTRTQTLLDIHPSFGLFMH